MILLKRHALSTNKLVCIDCNPGSSFLTLCALQVCTHLLVPVRPDRYSVLGLELLSEFVEGVPAINPKPETIIVLNGIPRKNYRPDVEDELRAHESYGSQTLANRIYQSRLLAANSDYTGFATDKPVAYRGLLNTEISSVADELAERIGIGN